MVGHTLMGYTVDEVKHMTYGRWYRLFRHYQNHFDNQVRGITFAARRAEAAKQDEWL